MSTANGNSLAALTHAAGELFSGHLKLARLEALVDASAIGRHVAVAACFAGLAAIGYVFAALGAAVLAQPILGWAATLLLLGALQLLVGSIGIYSAIMRLKSLAVFQRSAQAAGQSLAALRGNGDAKDTDNPRAAAEAEHVL